ncbi:hypothetical protein MICAB_3900006 [Microcystis aeruginosa PCC 9717]|uniref:Uncharacterized protein n=1 Tax=Microcystis aeruginosa PCC 9717 TaxID=1160286 RepID=I4FQD0_MICAE|nr:hypothetical protein MICAB_3900006 [Microcystis aeruginosa PCC 9717]
MSFYIRVSSLITPVHCITKTEEPELLSPNCDDGIAFDIDSHLFCYLLNLAMIETAHLPESARNLYLFLPDPDI